MIRLLLFCAVAGLGLGSAAPPADRPVPFSGGREPLPQETLAAIDRASSAATRPAAAAPPVAAPAPPPSPAPVVEEPSPDPTRGVHVVVSLPQQRAYVFRNGELVDSSRVSTGKKGYETPVGTFRILQKKVHHRSTTYDNAPMPYMQRLTWSGVALHAGRVPGYPASHGCIRFPRSFAKKLYGLTSFRSTVTITRAKPKKAADALRYS